MQMKASALAALRARRAGLPPRSSSARRRRTVSAKGEKVFGCCGQSGARLL